MLLACPLTTLPSQFFAVGVAYVTTAAFSKVLQWALPESIHSPWCRPLTAMMLFIPVAANISITIACGVALTLYLCVPDRMLIWPQQKRKHQESVTLVCCQKRHACKTKCDSHRPAGQEVAQDEDDAMCHGVRQDELLRQRLEEAVASEQANRKAPCLYLGVEVAPGVFEPSPNKWPAHLCPRGWQSHAKVHFEWQHVTHRNSPYRVHMHARDLLKETQPRNIPHHPLGASAPPMLTFTQEFMEALAANVHADMKFAGVVYGGDDVQMLQQVPLGGIDVQDTPLFWTFPDGRCESLTAKALAHLSGDELAPKDSQEAYLAVAHHLGYIPLGCCGGETFEAFLEAPGKLSAKQWETCTWEKPPKESDPGWWVVNPSEENQGQQARLRHISLVCLRFELATQRIATSVKLQDEWDRRQSNNERSVATLQQHGAMWRDAGGPDPDILRQPTVGDLQAAQAALSELARAGGQTQHQQPDLEAFLEDISRAVAKIKLLSWEAIRNERFPLTPEGLYGHLVQVAEARLVGYGAAESRRIARLEALDGQMEPEPTEESRGTMPASSNLRPPDKYGLDMGEFSTLKGRKPRGWKKAVAIASEVHIDEMRTLLEYHYDECHVECWRLAHPSSKRVQVPGRKSGFKVFRSALDAKHQQKTRQVALPSHVKQVLREPADEKDWAKLEAMRQAVLLEFQWLRQTYVDAEDVESLATAMESSSPLHFPGEVGPGSFLPEGSRILVEVSTTGTLQDQHERVVAFVRSCRGDMPLQVLLRPESSIDASLVDETAKALLNDTAPLQAICQRWKGGALSKEEILDRLLLVLWDAVFARQCDDWTQRGLANLSLADARDLGHWFVQGQKEGERPLFDGICAMCGELLHGAVNQTSGNKVSGPPMNRDGDQIPWPVAPADPTDDDANENGTILEDPNGEGFSTYGGAKRRQAYMIEVGGIELPAYSDTGYEHYNIVVLHLGPQLQGPSGPFPDGVFPRRWGAFKSALATHAAANLDWAGSKGVTSKIANLRRRGEGPVAFLLPPSPGVASMAAGLGPQPPFLLRWTPSFLAHEAAAVFEHNDDTNTLSLREGAKAPWLRPSAQADDENKWLYCNGCRDRWLPRHDGAAKSHVQSSCLNTLSKDCSFLGGSE